MTPTIEILNRAEEIQGEMHSMINKLVELSFRKNKNKKINYDDLTITFFLIKIAELEDKIRQLQEEKIIELN